MILGLCFLRRPIVFINTSYNISYRCVLSKKQFCISVRQKENFESIFLKNQGDLEFTIVIFIWLQVFRYIYLSGGKYKIGRLLELKYCPHNVKWEENVFILIKLTSVHHIDTLFLSDFFFLQENDAKSVSFPPLTLRMPIAEWVMGCSAPIRKRNRIDLLSKGCAQTVNHWCECSSHLTSFCLHSWA